MPDGRLLRITTPLGDDALIPIRLNAVEELGLPFRADVDVLAKNPKLKPSDLLTKEVTIKVVQVVQDQQIERFFNGVVAGFERLGPGAARRMTYRLTVRPALWKLNFRQDCRIFQKKTVKQIIETILEEHGLQPASWGILPAINPIPYCTQFNETDLHFISRLMEEYGITYYFSHAQGSHRLHISATAQGFPSYVGGQVEATHSSPRFFDFTDWSSENVVREATTSYEDMEEERYQPSTVLKKRSDTRAYEGEPSMWKRGETFEWPGGMSTRPGLDTAAVTMGELETLSEGFGAETRDPRFNCGVRLPVAVRQEDGSTDTQQYVVTAVRHRASDASGLIAGAGGTEEYNAQLDLVVASRTYMPEMRHERPVMAGFYSARVTGPPGEQIHVDEYGRIKVKFRWDRQGKNDDTSSCWIRVMQPAAGQWGGTWFLPRVDDEVLVVFLDGDPDRPVVVGSVYGKDAVPPFRPKENRAQSGYKTRSYKSKSDDDANILRFEDKKGSEEVFLHAQKDLAVEVEHDETRKIQNSRTTTIADSNDVLTLNSGNITTTCQAGSITIEAMKSITLKVGQNTIVIDQSGIALTGITITEEASLAHRTKSPMIEETADALVKIQGAIVTLN